MLKLFRDTHTKSEIHAHTLKIYLRDRVCVCVRDETHLNPNDACDMFAALGFEVKMLQ